MTFAHEKMSASAAVPATADRGDIHCPVCWELMLDPVAIPCAPAMEHGGHVFCRKCLHRIVGTGRQTGLPACPLCRGAVPAEFSVALAPSVIAVARAALAADDNGESTVLAESIASSTGIRLVLGNRHELVPNPRRSRPKGKHLNHHKWTAFVSGFTSAETGVMTPLDCDLLVDSVTFNIAPYYTAWPNSDRRSIRVRRNPMVRSAPFEVERVGWGSFPMSFTIKFKSEFGLADLEVEHDLCFEDGGHCHGIDIMLTAEQAKMLEKRKKKPKSTGRNGGKRRRPRAGAKSAETFRKRGLQAMAAIKGRSVRELMNSYPRI